MQNLRRKPTYNELINYLEFEQPKIKYPDRRATFLRNSPYLSQFDGDSWIDLEEQEQNINKEKMKEMTLKELASQRGLTAQAVRAQTQHYSMASSSSSASSSPGALRVHRSPSWSSGYDSAVQDFLVDIEHDQEEREAERIGILERGRQMFSTMLGQTEEQVARPGFLPQQEATQQSLPPLEDITPTNTPRLTKERKREIITELSRKAKITNYEAKQILEMLIIKRYLIYHQTKQRHHMALLLLQLLRLLV